MNNVKILKISCESHEECYRIAGSIHEQLRGNPDYINSEIVLHFSNDVNHLTEGDTEPNTIWVYVSDKVKTMPKLSIDLVYKENN